MADAIEQIEHFVTTASAELAAAKNAAELENWRIKYLGTKGSVKDLMKLMGTVPKEQKPAMGQKVNGAKQQLTTAFETKQAELGADHSTSRDAIDVTEPGARPELGNRHILMKVIDELTELFGRMGFSVASGPEVEDEFHNFIALNIPRQHPARDPLDNFLSGGRSLGCTSEASQNPNQHRADPRDGNAKTADPRGHPRQGLSPRYSGPNPSLPVQPIRSAGGG